MKPSLRNALLCVLSLLAPPALADDGFGVLMGTVLDMQTRTVVEGVVVTATSPVLMGEQTVVTDENGFYWIPQLPAGVYTLRFEHERFIPYAYPTLPVRINTTYRMNVEVEQLSHGTPVRMTRGSVSVPCWPRRFRERGGSY